MFLLCLCRITHGQSPSVYVHIEGGLNEDGTPYQYIIRNDSLLLFSIDNKDTIRLLKVYRITDNVLKSLSDSFNVFRFDTLHRSYINNRGPKHPHSYYFNIKYKNLNKYILVQEYYIYELIFIQNLINSIIEEKEYRIYLKRNDGFEGVELELEELEKSKMEKKLGRKSKKN